MKNNNLLGFSMVVFGFTTLIILLVMGLISYIQFDMRCKQYLKRAGDANNIELAKSNLDSAIKYLEKNDLTNGVVSIFLRQPKNDIGFWYSNLTACRVELDDIDEGAAQLEKSNVLMKLRETLLDSGEKGDTVVTCPSGLYIYPYNGIYFWFTMIGIAVIGYGAYLLLMGLE